MALRELKLDDKYTTRKGRVFISGYRGSPLGGYDASLWKEQEQLAAHDILFQPGVNEDLAATAVIGTQQLDEVLVTRYRLPLVHKFVRANNIDKVTLDSSRRQLGIVTAGKTYQDLIQALSMLGINTQRAEEPVSLCTTPCLSTSKPAPRKSAGVASAGHFPTRRNVSS
jgi:TPP-dependent indolepyruvate ferredoxin oxidoreductase alpha subunit